jgi:hypothetical protein
MTNASICKIHLSFGPLIAAAEIDLLKTVVKYTVRSAMAAWLCLYREQESCQISFRQFRARHSGCVTGKSGLRCKSAWDAMGLKTVIAVFLNQKHGSSTGLKT